MQSYAATYILVLRTDRTLTLLYERKHKFLSKLHSEKQYADCLKEYIIDELDIVHVHLFS